MNKAFKIVKLKEKLENTILELPKEADKRAELHCLNVELENMIKRIYYVYNSAYKRILKWGR